MDLRHYYHLFVDGDFEQIAREHFSALLVSGLLPRLQRLHIGMVGTRERAAHAERLVRKLADRNFTVSVWPEGWEQETLDILHADAVGASSPFVALYAHGKGAAHKDKASAAWRRTMNRYVINDWREATGKLDGMVGAVGCFWIPPIEKEPGLFGGNFWWARSSAIAQLGRPLRSDRYDAETWISGITELTPPYTAVSLYDGPIIIDSATSIVVQRLPLPT